MIESLQLIFFELEIERLSREGIRSVGTRGNMQIISGSYFSRYLAKPEVLAECIASSARRLRTIILLTGPGKCFVYDVLASSGSVDVKESGRQREAILREEGMLDPTWDKGRCSLSLRSTILTDTTYSQNGDVMAYCC